MALETLKGFDEIGGFQIVREKPKYISWDEFDELRNVFPINITERINCISFKIQCGPIKEVGTNGCQVDTLIEASKLIIEGLNEKYPCRENALAITKLEEALHWLNRRRIDRIKRNVEGYSKV